jgi:hypothetical protein
MELTIRAIEEIDLPNYIETTWSGDKFVKEGPAPLLAKYRVELSTPAGTIELFYECRDTPHGHVQIDEYYYDQVYDALMTLVSSMVKKKESLRAYNELNGQITNAVFEKYAGALLQFPITVLVETK